jgi:hypothetical protein
MGTLIRFCHLRHFNTVLDNPYEYKHYSFNIMILKS